MMGVYPAGSVVQLTDDRYALVMQVNSSRPLKPRVLVHDPRMPRDEALLLDLERQGELGIRRSVQPAKLPPAAGQLPGPQAARDLLLRRTERAPGRKRGGRGDMTRALRRSGQQARVDPSGGGRHDLAGPARGPAAGRLAGGPGRSRRGGGQRRSLPAAGAGRCTSWWAAPRPRCWPRPRTWATGDSLADDAPGAAAFGHRCCARPTGSCCTWSAASARWRWKPAPRHGTAPADHGARPQRRAAGRRTARGGHRRAARHAGGHRDRRHPGDRPGRAHPQLQPPLHPALGHARVAAVRRRRPAGSRLDAAQRGRPRALPAPAVGDPGRGAAEQHRADPPALGARCSSVSAARCGSAAARPGGCTASGT